MYKIETKNLYIYIYIYICYCYLYYYYLYYYSLFIFIQIRKKIELYQNNLILISNFELYQV